MSEMTVLHPKGWAPAKGYSNGVMAEGRVVFIAGQVAFDAQAKIMSGDFVTQVEQALKNVVSVLAEAGGEPKHITRLTWFVTDKKAYVSQQAKIGEAYRRVIGRHFPAMSLLVVSALLEDDAKVEIEATAVLPR